MPNSPLGFMDALGNIARALIDSSRRLLVSVDAVSIAGGRLPVDLQAITSNRYPNYVATVQQHTTGAAAGAGTQSLTGATVPAGQVWILDSVSGVNQTTVGGNIQIYIISGGQRTATIGLLPQTGGVGWFVAGLVGAPIVLGPGDAMRATFTNCVLADGLQMDLHGYQSSTT